MAWSIKNYFQSRQLFESDSINGLLEMLEIKVPNKGNLAITHVLFDMNGTIATGGIIDTRVSGYLEKIREILKICIISADTFGTLEKMAGKYNLEYHIIPRKNNEAKEKQDTVKKYGGEHVIAVGNGNNDTLMLEEAAIGIGIMGSEGISRDCLLAADIIVGDICHACSLILDPRKLVATLRT